jgi:hypothetical protein
MERRYNILVTADVKDAKKQMDAWFRSQSQATDKLQSPDSP